MLIEIISIIITILAVAGVILNNRHIIWCFPIWLFSNSLSAGVHLHAELYGLAVRDAVFLVLAVEGWRMWARRKNT